MKHKFVGARILLVQNRLESGFQSCVKPFLVRPILKPPMSSNYFVMFGFLQTLEIKLEQHVRIYAKQNTKLYTLSGSLENLFLFPTRSTGLFGD